MTTNAETGPNDSAPVMASTTAPRLVVGRTGNRKRTAKSAPPKPNVIDTVYQNAIRTRWSRDAGLRRTRRAHRAPAQARVNSATAIAAATVHVARQPRPREAYAAPAPSPSSSPANIAAKTLR